jgi:2-dehydro-3-deoxyphosphogluconate aldolase/(4S)-4-hydroxy-2-oxoglutarate aldolase
VNPARSWSKQDILTRIREVAVIPVVRVSCYEHAICGIEGVIRAGMNVVEITMTVPGALKMIEEAIGRYGDAVVIGAGTVLSVQQCTEAIAAGAQFVVSPVRNDDVIRTAKDRDVVCMPGALTPSEVFDAWSAGADIVKVFPVSSVGGPSYIRALKGPLPQVEVVVTGGVTLETAPEFLKAGAVAVGIGESVLVKQALVNNDVDTICTKAKFFLDTIRANLSQAS